MALFQTLKTYRGQYAVGVFKMMDEQDNFVKNNVEKKLKRIVREKTRGNIFS